MYYICGGTAYFKKNTRLKPGYLYLFQADPDFEVSQDEADPVDHLYFDFLTYHKNITSDFIEIDIEDKPMLKNIILSA